jgi:hypothetical protein
MSAAEDVLISYLLNSAWQIPLLLVASLLVARLVRPIGIAAEHRVWVAALVCQAVLPAVSLWSRDPFHIAWPWLARSSPVAQANVAVQMGPGIGMGTLRLSSGLMAVIAAMYAAAILYFASRFAWRCARVARLTRTSEPLNPWHNASIAAQSMVSPSWRAARSDFLVGAGVRAHDGRIHAQARAHSCRHAGKCRAMRRRDGDRARNGARPPQ